MCGRFALVPQLSRLNAQFHLEEPIDERVFGYNIAPGASVLFLCAQEGISLNALTLQWGLVPFWVKDTKNIGSLINARAETLFEKPAFSSALKSRRGIMVMSGFYEWRQEKGVKQPYYFKQQQGDYLAIAALWDTCVLASDEVIHSCCLITTKANSSVSPIHSRMPVILSKAGQNIWLNNNQYQPDQLSTLFVPNEESELSIYPVTRQVNFSRFQSPEAILPLPWDDHSKGAYW